jgi:hypothetical protein
MARSTPDPFQAHTCRPVDLAAESVAGEEDPGASMDIGAVAAASNPPSGTGSPQGQAPMSPGDEAPAGTPGTGEKVCPSCGGSGRKAGGVCPECGGTGRITAAIGGA